MEDDLPTRLDASASPPDASTSTLSPPPAGTTAGSNDGSPPTTAAAKRKLTRSRAGCVVCRKRKKRCDTSKPTCGACQRLGLPCEWEDPETAQLERTKRREEKKALKRERLAREAAEKKAAEPSIPMFAAPQAGPSSELGWGMAGTWGGPSSNEGVQPYNPADPRIEGLSLSSAPYASSIQPPSTPWQPFLSSFAPTLLHPPTPGSEHGAPAWSTAFSGLVSPYTPHAPAAELPVVPPFAGAGELPAWLTAPSPTFDLSSLLRSPTPPQPFAPVFNFDNLSHPFPVDNSIAPSSSGSHSLPQLDANSISDAIALYSRNSSAVGAVSDRSLSLNVPSTSSSSTLATSVQQATSLLASADFHFTKSYLLSHYTTSLAHVVSLAADPSSPSRSPSAQPASASITSANLFLSLIPLSEKHPYLLSAILAWSAANLAASSADRAQELGTSEGTSVMATLSNELGIAAERELEELQEQIRLGDGEQHVDWEAVLAARLMLSQASICSGDVGLWRTRLRQAAEVVQNGLGIKAARKSPLSRALVKNLLYHDVLSSTKEGLLLDYSQFGKASGGTPATASDGTTPVDMETGEEEEEDFDETEEELLDTLMGLAGDVFLIIGRCTSLAKDKHRLQASDEFGEDELNSYLGRIEELRLELEREKERIEVFVLDRPEYRPHLHFHEVFRLAALLYLNMLAELPPRSLPTILLVRKMLSLTELIVNESLPGLCSMHFPLYLLQLNSTPIVAPLSHTTDRQRASAAFNTHMSQFAFLNTKRSQLLIAEVWQRSNDGRIFVDADSILAEWGWDLNWA